MVLLAAFSRLHDTSGVIYIVNLSCTKARRLRSAVQVSAWLCVSLHSNKGAKLCHATTWRTVHRQHDLTWRRHSVRRI